MRDFLGGSWMDEFCKIAEEKGWVIKKEAISHAELEKVWGGLPKNIKDEIIPGWDNMSFSDLVSQIELKWGPILMKYRENQVPKGEVTIDPEKVKVTQPAPKPRSSMSPQLIAKVQAFIMRETGIPVSNPKNPETLGGPDGMWGKRSATAWNTYAEKINGAGGPQVIENVDPDGRELPRMDNIRYIFQMQPKAKVTMGPEEIKDLSNIKVPTQEEILQKMKGKAPGQQPGDVVVQPGNWRRRYNVRGLPSDVIEGEHLATMRLLRQQGHRGPVKDKGQYVKALNLIRKNRKMRPQKQEFVPKIPEWAKADDVTASVVNELISLATDLENLGEEKAAITVDRHLKLYTEAADKLYDITGETGEQLIGQAHPGGGPTLVPAAEEGGKVETIVEEQKKNIQKVTKNPTGKYAEIMTKLISTANKLDEEGEIEAAKIVDQTIRELAESRPFENRSTVSEASGSKDTTASIKKEASLDPKMVARLRTLSVFVYAPLNIVISDNLFDSGRAGDELKKIYTSAAALIKKGVKEILSKSYKEQLQGVKDLKQAANDLLTKSVSIDPEDALGSWDKKHHYKALSWAKNLKKATSEVKLMQPVSSRWKQAYLNLLKSMQKAMTERSIDDLNNIFGGKETQVEQVLAREVAKVEQSNLPETYYKSGIRWFKNNIGRRLGVAASQNIKLTKDADDSGGFVAPTLFNKPTTPAAPGAKPKVVEKKPVVNKKYRPKKDPDVERLQDAMIRAGIKLPRFGSDGRWGGETMKGWEQLRKMFPRANLSPASKNYNQLKPEFSRAIRFANFMAKKTRQQEIKFKVDGKEYSSGDLATTTDFLAALDRIYKLNRNEMHEDEYLKSVKVYLAKIFKSLKGDEGKFVSNYHGPQVLNMLLRRVLSLWKTIGNYGLPFKKETPGLPSTPGVKPGTPKQEKLPGYGLGREKKDEGQFKELTTESSPAEIYRAIANLPEAGWLRTTRNFTMKARSVIPKTEKDPVRKYWDDLDARIRKIVGALSAQKAAIKAMNNGAKAYTDMVDAIQTFIGEHKYIGGQLGYVTE